MEKSVSIMLILALTLLQKSGLSLPSKYSVAPKFKDESTIEF